MWLVLASLFARHLPAAAPPPAAPNYHIEPSVTVGQVTVPLEADLTVQRAYTLNHSSVWTAGRLQFLTPELGLKSQLIPTEPFSPGRIPVIFVHGTFSSPVWWGEMFNTLEADSEIRKRFQIWLYLYGSSKPILVSAAELRDAITVQVARLDPKGENPALQQMLVIGHSQGGPARQAHRHLHRRPALACVQYQSPRGFAPR